MEKKPFVQPTLTEEASLAEVTLQASGQVTCPPHWSLVNGQCYPPQ